jgi:putative FmdB family regulatory protein
MPTYQYHCAAGHVFERVQKMSDKPLRKCPECGAKAERAVSGGAGLIFKGSGFYITDYGKDGKGPRKDAAETPAAPAASAADKPAKEAAVTPSPKPAADTPKGDA